MESPQALQCPAPVFDRPRGEMSLLYLTAISLVTTSVRCISSWLFFCYGLFVQYLLPKALAQP